LPLQPAMDRAVVRARMAVIVAFNTRVLRFLMGQ
jgi:hypothetical protein